MRGAKNQETVKSYRKLIEVGNKHNRKRKSFWSFAREFFDEFSIWHVRTSID